MKKIITLASFLLIGVILGTLLLMKKTKTYVNAPYILQINDNYVLQISHNFHSDEINNYILPNIKRIENIQRRGKNQGKMKIKKIELSLSRQDRDDKGNYKTFMTIDVTVDDNQRKISIEKKGAPSMKLYKVYPV